MNNVAPLLSICIPTYNRSGYLKRCIDSIIRSAKDLSEEEIEIVISDNASTDDTPNVVQYYLNQYKWIKYERNEENIGDNNFPLALYRGSGIFRKLSNDTLEYTKEGLSTILKFIRLHKENKPLMCFLNSGRKSQWKSVSSLDEFACKMSFYLTWIGTVGVWDVDCTKEKLGELGCDEHLWQVPYLLHTMLEKKYCVILYTHFAESIVPEKKDLSYGVFCVFHDTYLKYLRQYVSLGHISNYSYNYIEKDLLLRFFPSAVVNSMTNNAQAVYSKKENLKKLLYAAYKSKPYYCLYRIRLCEVLLKRKIKSWFGK